MSSKTVVGIGASAGGLESLERFFKHCPNNLGVSYVIVQHLSTQYKSMMDDLIHRYTSMPVHMIDDGLELQPNEIYLIPAGKLVTLNGSRFCLTDKSEHAFHLPIDVFFKSLAEHFSAQAIAVVLSGTGTDGSRGAVQINASGGLVIAQDPLDAKFDGMPASLIATGIVDAIVVAEDIPQRISAHLENPVSIDKPGQQKEPATSIFDIPDDLEAITQIVASKTGIDFKEYKWATVSRRLERRMQVNKVKRLSDYRNILQNSQEEVIALRRELLIPVTSFFRDEDAFSNLATEVIPLIVKDANPNDGIRVWVAGCATGEEAYSLAILFLEAIAGNESYIPLKIFATDINPEILENASQGTFFESIVSEVPEALLKRYFIVDEQNRYSVIPEVRQCIVFAKHNLLTDPPFTKMNLVSCRNTLIYFKSTAQDVVLQKLQYALRERGYLFLGKSESLTVNAKKFEVIDSKSKLYQVIEPVFVRDLDSRTLKTRYSLDKKTSVVLRNLTPSGDGFVAKAQEVLTQTYIPCSVLVDSDMDVMHIFGEPGKFLKLKGGAYNNNLSHLMHERLAPIVTTLFYRLKKTKEPIETQDIELELDGHRYDIRLGGQPISLGEGGTQYLIVLSTLAKARHSESLTPEIFNSDTTERIRQLEVELAATRESLQSTIEELETTNEELQATNEELMASNEELQSSNEELQSVNEELNTVNAEYHEKMNILNQINADLDAMGKATSIATIFVNEKLNITRYTPDARLIFKLREHDIGRPLNDMSHVLLYDGLFDDLEEVIHSGVSKEREVISKDGKYYLVRIVFYRLTQYTQGAVISFVDISAIKQSANLQTIIDALPEHIAVLSHSGEILMVNRAWTQFAKANGDPKGEYTGVGTNYLNVCGVDSDNKTAQEAYKGVKAVLEGSLHRSFLEYPCHSATEKRWFAMETIGIKHDVFAAVVSHFNISAWKLKMESEQ